MREIHMTEPTEHSDPPSVAAEISRAMEELYSSHYGHPRSKAITYINGKTVLCMIEDSKSDGETAEFKRGEGDEVIDRRVAFQVNHEDAFTEAVERITECNVVAFLSANQENLTFAAELFVLDREPSRP